jgi:oligopeptidase B
MFHKLAYMKLKDFLPAATLLILSCNNSTEVKRETFKWPEGVVAPVAEKKPYKMEAHGDVRIDDYYWMNDYFKEGPDSTKVVDYLKAENLYLDTMLSASKQFREDLFKEMKGRIKEKDESVPYKLNGYWYYNRYEEGKQYPVYCRKKESLDAAEEIMHDANKAAEGTKYYSAAGLSVSDNNEMMTIGEDDVSRRLYKLRFKNLATGQFSPETITNTEGGSYAWAADNKTVFYIKKDIVTLLGFQVWRHVVGTDPATDVKVFEEKERFGTFQILVQTNEEKPTAFTYVM